MLADSIAEHYGVRWTKHPSWKAMTATATFDHVQVDPGTAKAKAKKKKKNAAKQLQQRLIDSPESVASNSDDAAAASSRPVSPLPSSQAIDEPEPEPKVTSWEVTLLKPLLLMNVSGKSVALAAKSLNITNPSHILVLHDDLERALGKLGVKYGGSTAGHNGLKSIIASLPTSIAADGKKRDDFTRIRIGIGRPTSNSPDVVADYVLSKFKVLEQRMLDDQVFPAFMAQWPEAYLPKDSK
ncbi:peptidyl-tRNA hydrolase [Ramicandelaber brevisporus]|nr:peptidyl-tRNA hydrolase [Ramicandelaber brevisporus]